MQKIFFFFILIASSLSHSQSLEISTTDALVNFNYYSKSTEGTLKNIQAEINLNFTDLSQSVISGTADVSTLSTENKGRDQHLMAEDFFDVEKYPTMKFISSEIYQEDDLYFVKGKLTIKDVEQEVVFAMTVNETSIVLSVEIYGLDYGVATKKDREHSLIGVNIVFDIE